MRGWRGAAASLVGLSMLQLILSTSQGNGGTGKITALLTYPTAWLRDLADPTKPGLPQSKTAKATNAVATSTPPVVNAVANGLSNVPTTTGTGASTLPAGTLPPTYT